MPGQHSSGHERGAKPAQRHQMGTVAHARDELKKIITPEVREEEYDEIRFLAEGSEGSNWLCWSRRDSKLVVRKSYDAWMYQDDRRMPREAYILQHVIPANPRILYCEGWEIHSNQKLDMYFAYCEGGDLGRYIPRPGSGQPEDFLWHVFTQIADALVFLRKYFSNVTCEYVQFL